jgi:hypothetical protein
MGVGGLLKVLRYKLLQIFDAINFFFAINNKLQCLFLASIISRVYHLCLTLQNFYRVAFSNQTKIRDKPVNLANENWLKI